ncbi:cysteine-rich CWC family protein [Paraburkholderia phenoliruptrix]|uniref:cysteine-rich CWC family protein n=1 Tax=Paraburkholderia phenoliruptrix TaxID=252970 RepID=UPI001C6E66B9|nr:cysteine-rich CWC family protein [Paraburkholderia phenoliruptrix]MBW9106162.1 cysteine-rich CWC family protein [Paraburkholderia phenoliruptrix]MBW9130904.1 cysteine-rich CWC family protein [Paraburkholderia ginsengiterrae]
MKPSASRPPGSARCPRCGNAFDCAMHAEPFDCWCRQMPPLPRERLDPSGRCLCPECLAAEIARVAQPESGAESP